MNYFLFLNHPKGEEVYKVSKKAEGMARKYFSQENMLETKVKIDGKEYDAIVDWEVFSKDSNFDCFNCNNDCCADSPSKLKKQTRKLLIDNKDEFNEITKNIDIAYELGYEEEDLLKEIEKEEKREIIENIEEGTEMCFYSYKRDDRATLCGIHSLCFSKNMGYKEVCHYKPLVCLLWPLEILAEDDNSKLYITLPDDFTNNFTIEDYYEIPCINKEYSQSMLFRKRNVKGFLEEDYKPFIEQYKETLINTLGEEFYQDVKNKLEENNYL